MVEIVLCFVGADKIVTGSKPANAAGHFRHDRKREQNSVNANITTGTLHQVHY